MDLRQLLPVAGVHPPSNPTLGFHRARSCRAPHRAARSVAVIRIRFEVIPDVSRFLKSAKRGTLRNFALELKLTLYRPGCRPDYRPMPLRERLICAVLLGKNAYEIRVVLSVVLAAYQGISVAGVRCCPHRYNQGRNTAPGAIGFAPTNEWRIF